MSYLKRVVDDELKARLEAFGAVLIEGPKWCGKTTTAAEQAASVLALHDVDMREEYLATVETKPSLLLAGATPRLIDEWQDAPQLWDAVRRAVDERQAPGQFILTGSNAVDRAGILHSGIGRISRLRMNPMSLWESGESSGEVSLRELFENPSRDIDGARAKLSVEELVFVACRGGWPAALNLKGDKAKLSVARNYVDGVCHEDMRLLEGVSRDARVTRAILRSYARNVSTLAKKTSILSDITSSGEVSLSASSLDNYLDALRRLFVIDDIDAWSPAIRSKTAVRAQVKRGFSDPSIAVAALGLSREALLTQMKTFGFVFEQMCARDLKAYLSGFNPHLSYYRDRYGLEADLVLHLDDGRYALIECKLGSRGIDEGARHLLKIKELVRERNRTEAQTPLREPDLLVILTGGTMALRRPDGVLVIPLSALRP